uniref:Uncharacterized protein n=1 Tax=Cucumis melo TaxID=3656 RepID=A0A9I9EBY5_CUCME
MICFQKIFVFILCNIFKVIRIWWRTRKRKKLARVINNVLSSFGLGDLLCTFNPKATLAFSYSSGKGKKWSFKNLSKIDHSSLTPRPTNQRQKIESDTEAEDLCSDKQ